MIRDTLLNGIADTDIRREVLGTTDIITTAINDIIALVESKEIARNAIPSTSVVNVTGIKRQETHLPRRRTLEKEQAPCPFCKKLYNLYREGPLGTNIKPFTSCIDCFRLRRKARRRTQSSTLPTAIQSLQKSLESLDQLSAVYQSTPSPKGDETVVITRQSDTTHHTFKKVSG